MSPKTWDALKWLGLLLGLPAGAFLGGGLGLSPVPPVLQGALFGCCVVLWVLGAWKARPGWKGGLEAAVGLALLILSVTFVRDSVQGPYFARPRRLAALARKLPQARGCSGFSEAEKAALVPQLKAALVDPEADVRGGAEECLLRLGVSTATIVFPGSPGP